MIKDTFIEQGQTINAVHTLGGRAIAAARISFADKRYRHIGLSHHKIFYGGGSCWYCGGRFDWIDIWFYDMSLSVQLSFDASGAALAAKNDQIVVIYVIDMSTTCEAALDAGALSIYGAAPDNVSCPVFINPERIGWLAGLEAVKEKRQ
ncbi:MAG: DUF3866 family protein [Desulfotomaculum sp.]|nr:DUF3866 family protein [Desulfotomaculum sp.]